MHEHNLTCQPLLFAVARINRLDSVYVVINRTRYRFADLMDAVDCCFKSFFSLNAFYPVECDHVWGFMERFIYKIKVPKVSHSFIAVTTLISDLAGVDANEISD